MLVRAWPINWSPATPRIVTSASTLPSIASAATVHKAPLGTSVCSTAMVLIPAFDLRTAAVVAVFAACAYLRRP